MTMNRGIMLGLAAVLAAGSMGYAQAPPATSAALTEEQMGSTQDDLIKLLRVSPTLVSVIERDPSLLADQAYISRLNPELEAFLTAHPEVTRNPDFYLFTGFNGDRGRRGHQVLQHKVWQDQNHEPESPSGAEILNRTIMPFLVFLGITGALIWLIRTFLENRRWSRALKLQMDTHTRLIERFSTNQELLVYMQTEAGKRFLESAPIAADFGQSQRVPNAVARVLTPLQIGVVLTLLGAGLLGLRHSQPGFTAPFLVAGIVVLMPGLGFIISAGLTWLLAGRLGLIPEAMPASSREQM